MYEALNCRCCGGVLNVNSGLCVCKYCHTTNFISDVASKYIYQLNHANKLRQECEFDNAIRIYDTILGENTPTADILWYRTLCEYGIEYVPDPVSDQYFPTLHRINDESILECSFFKKAIELSEGEQKETLLKEAEYIYKVQTKYLNIASCEDPYDVFICYKETDVETGEKTEDVLLAEELYNELTGMGYKVFFARETLKEKLSIDYEPYIFAALKSARAMAVIGTKAEYFSSVWVKNEWGRFLKLMEKDPDKQMFFACDDPEELPRAFASKQAQILGSEGAIKNLAANMKKFLKDSSSFIRSDSNNIINQDAFDKLIEEKSREYVERLDRTKFGEKEKSVRDSIWKTYGNVEYKNKIRSNTFHIGSLLIILSQIIISIYFAHSLANPEFYLADKNQKGIFLFCSLVIGLFLVGTVILFSTKIIVDAYKDNSQEAFFVLPGALAIVLYTSLILGILFYFLLPIIVFAIPFIIL